MLAGDRKPGDRGVETGLGQSTPHDSQSHFFFCFSFFSSVALRPQRPQGLSGTGSGAQDVHLDSLAAPEL